MLSVNERGKISVILSGGYEAYVRYRPVRCRRRKGGWLVSASNARHCAGFPDAGKSSTPNVTRDMS